MISASKHRTIYFVVLPTVQLLDLTGPVQAFDEARQLGANYELKYVGITQSLRSAQGLDITNLLLYHKITIKSEDMIILSGVDASMLSKQALNEIEPKFYQWIVNAYEHGAIISSVCNSTFILAETGLLDQKRCTTHWKRTQQLQDQYPDLTVVENCLFIKNRRLCTSAGSTSGIDLSLSLIEDDYGPIFTAKVAKELVLYLRRTGQENQLSFYLDYRNHTNLIIHSVQDFLIQHPSEKVTLDELSEKFNISTRHLTRQFKAETGITVNEFVQRLRMEIAVELMKNKNYSIREISEKCGFDNPRHFRRLWKHYSLTKN